MTQFLNNVWIALTTENPQLLSFLYIPFGLIENYLLMNVFLIILNVNANIKQKLLYTISLTIINILGLNFILSPFNVMLNYVCMLLFIMFVFKLNILKSCIALVLSVFTFALLNILLQNPYLTFCNITLDTFTNIPIYRYSYLAILYIDLLLICIFLRNFKNIKFNLSLLDNLDKKTLTIIVINICIGILTLCIQLVTTAFYIDIVPVIITILNFILLISFLILSIYSFTRMIKLANTKKDLECAEDYNKSLEILYDEVKGFKHDFENIVSTLDGFIENSDMTGLKKYFNEVKKDCKITNNLSVLNPRIINNAGIYSLLNNKYFKATNLGITFYIEYFIDLNNLDVNLYKLSRILGILLDNAIEEAEKCSEKIVKVDFIRENRNNRAVITVQNTYSNKNVDTETIFNKGFSGKQNHSGIGLWEVRNYVKKSKNLDLFTTKTEKLFKQELSIYDL